jgi:hypothetical protein
MTIRQLWSIICGRTTNFRWANASWTYHPEGDPRSGQSVTVTVSGPTGSGKSAIAGEIEIALKSIGLPVEWKNADREHWTHGNEYWIDLYKPTVTIVEQNIPRIA